ncbi:hypothetical protein [Mycolicibacterium lacusdiani]|uniref:hypothetical protein n=1 Tax=Mycolicibacterium lacusdiani TaxID=2895283 RepID=UPI001F26BC48|nr:hypothetical protein [Mycolicibacterium lacusdiani]
MRIGNAFFLTHGSRHRVMTALAASALVLSTIAWPALAEASPSDEDGDGFANSTEIDQIGTDPYKADTDGDGLSDPEEFNVTKTNPVVPDSDGDGANDGSEIKNGTNPLVADSQSGSDDERPDSDGDGLFDDDERDVYGTNADRPDTDFDGRDDGQEVYDGTNPRVPLF